MFETLLQGVGRIVRGRPCQAAARCRQGCDSDRQLALRAGRPSKGREIVPGIARGDRGDLLGCAGGDDAAALVAALGTEVDDPVRGLDHVQVVLDHDHRVAAIDQRVRAPSSSLLDVVEVQSGGRLVQDVERAARWRACASSVAELDALRLAAGERGGRLAEMDVAEPDRRRACRALRAICGMCREELECLLAPSSRARRRCSSPCSAPRASRGCSACPCRPRR